MSDAGTGRRPAAGQIDWVERVLKLKVGTAGKPGGATMSPKDIATWQSACAEFQSAVETVSARIETLRQAVAAYGREADDEEMQELAKRSDLGLNGFTNNTFVRLRAALMEAGGNDPARLKAAVPKVVSNAELVAAALQGNEQVEVADDNPFDVPVDIIGTLIPTLTRLRTVGAGMVRG